jgi:hypothetical protein
VDAPENTCEPNHARSTPMGSVCTVQRGYVGARSHTHMRAHAHVDTYRGSSLAHAGIGDPIMYVGTRMDPDTCMYHAYKYHKFARSHLYITDVYIYVDYTSDPSVAIYTFWQALMKSPHRVRRPLTVSNTQHLTIM